MTPTTTYSGKYAILKHKKLLTIISILLLCLLPVEVLTSPGFGPNQKFQGIGHWLDNGFLYLILPIGILLYLRKLNKDYLREEDKIVA
jgi:hypothetical protein